MGDIYTISPFGNRLLTYDLTGKELAQTVVNGFKNANYGDQFSGMVVTYTRAPDTVNEDGRPVRGEVTVRSITLDDGTVVDINDDTKTYRVCVNEYCATLAGSVFENKTPVQDINEAPIDNTSAIAALREIGKANDGKLPLDLTPRCVPVDICSLYPDVNTEYWYHSGIHYALETGLMVGYEDQTFRPDEQLSRAMAVTVLYRLAGEPEVTAADTFSDVPDNVWYTNAVAWAVEEGYVYGYDDGCFRPDQSVSRQELVAILYRYAEKNGYDMQAGGDLSGFTDVDALHDFAKTPMAWATGKSLVEGMENQTLQPLGTATRAQFVTLMLRLSKLTEAAE